MEVKGNVKSKLKKNLKTQMYNELYNRNLKGTLTYKSKISVKSSFER